MSETKQACSRVTAVGCSVEGCVYHTKENRCSANKIDVKNESAMKKAETFCSTFTTKTTN